MMESTFLMAMGNFQAPHSQKIEALDLHWRNESRCGGKVFYEN